MCVQGGAAEESDVVAPEADMAQQDGWAEQNQQMQNNTDQPTSDAEVGTNITEADNY